MCKIFSKTRLNHFCWKSELTGGRRRWLDYQGDADSNFLWRDKKVPPRATSAHLGITACGIRRKNSTIGTKNSRNIKFDIFRKTIDFFKFSHGWFGAHSPCCPLQCSCYCFTDHWYPLLQVGDAPHDFIGEEVEEKRTKSFPIGRPNFLTKPFNFPTELPNIQMIPPKPPAPPAT